VVIDESTAGSTTNHCGMRGTIRWMAPEIMYPEKFGFVGRYRKRLPSRSTDIYALGMTVLEVSAFASTIPPTEVSCGFLGRSLRDVARSVMSTRGRPSCAKSSKGTDRTDHLQDFRISCGNCWRAPGVWNTGPNPQNGHRPLSYSID
jgi:serine/threonine protein kinase